MNIDLILFENYLDRIFLEDEAMIIYTEKTNQQPSSNSSKKSKLKTAAKFTLAISAIVAVIIIGKKIMKSKEISKKEKEEAQKRINELETYTKELREENKKFKEEMKKMSGKIHDNERAIEGNFRRIRGNSQNIEDLRTKTRSMRSTIDAAEYNRKELQSAFMKTTIIPKGIEVSKKAEDRYSNEYAKKKDKIIGIRLKRAMNTLDYFNKLNKESPDHIFSDDDYVDATLALERIYKTLNK